MFEFKFLASHLSNKGSSRGVALLAERRTKVELDYCSFNNNESTDLGGSIFNRGSMKISNSAFSKNLGNVSCFHFLLNVFAKSCYQLVVQKVNLTLLSNFI